MEDDKPKGFLKDSDGDNSSKRLWGSIFLIAGGALLMAIGIVSIFLKVTDPSTALSAGNAIIIVGASLLGIGVLEGVGKNIGGGK